jgi:hypothetical protein
MSAASSSVRPIWRGVVALLRTVCISWSVHLDAQHVFLRHASITAALDTSNGDVRAAQAHARHASPQTTMRYDDNRQDLAGKVAASLAKALTFTP